MTEQSYAYDTIAWAKQRLDDLEGIIAAAEKAVGNMSGEAGTGAREALESLKASRAKVLTYYQELRVEERGRDGIEQIQDKLEDEWIEIESRFQSLLASASSQTETVRHIVIDRALAQRRSWQGSTADLRARAARTVEDAKGELDAAITRLSEEADKFQIRIGEAKDAGDLSWTAVKNGLSETREIHDRTMLKIKDALSKLL